MFYCHLTFLLHRLHSVCPQLTTMLSITLDLILMRQTMPGSRKVCRCAINLLRKEHELIRSKQLVAILSGKSNTHLPGRVRGKLWHDKKSLYSGVHLEKKRLECSYQLFTLSVLTSILCVNSLWCSAGRIFAICGIVLWSVILSFIHSTTLLHCFTLTVHTLFSATPGKCLQ